MKTKYLSIVLLTLTISTSSCENWFDVSPKADVKADDLFQDENGFRDVLTGVYALMTTENTYGRQLTFGYVDVLAQYYDRITKASHEYIKTVNFKYDEPIDQEVLKKTWSVQYKAISNLNILLEYAEKNKQAFNTETIYRIYKGEALALRAFLHFDLLRLFAPSPEMGKDRKAIPYMESYTNITPPRSTVTEVLEKVIKDLNAARDLMRNVDSYGPNYTALHEEHEKNKQLKNRSFHLNYYAATALLARVQLYAGQPQEALISAQEIIGTPESLPVQPFQLATAANASDRLFKNELLFGLDLPSLEDITDPYFGKTASELGLTNSEHILAFSVSARDELFAPANPSDHDYRLKLWFKETSSTVANMSNKLAGQVIMPLLRIPELYYIAAECAGGTQGLAYLNKIRAYRGLNAIESTKDLQNEIYKEYCKEFLNEGQLFYYFKRKNLSQMGVFKHVNIEPEHVYILPLPIDEQDFGNKNQEQAL